MVASCLTTHGIQNPVFETGWLRLESCSSYSTRFRSISYTHTRYQPSSLDLATSRSVAHLPRFAAKGTGNSSRSQKTPGVLVVAARHTQSSPHQRRYYYTGVWQKPTNPSCRLCQKHTPNSFRPSFRNAQVAPLSTDFTINNIKFIF